MSIVYARKSDAPNTHYETFKAVKHSSRDGLGSAAVTDADTGKSPLSRWITYAFNYADFTSNLSGATGYEVNCLLPAQTMAFRCWARVDTAFVGTGNNDIDVGDDTDPDGWGDGLDFSSTGGKYDPDAAYNPNGTTGFTYNTDVDSVDVQFKNATAPTAGEAMLFIEVVSYHEALSNEW
jgi:hypothetical protein